MLSNDCLDILHRIEEHLVGRIERVIVPPPINHLDGLLRSLVVDEDSNVLVAVDGVFSFIWVGELLVAALDVLFDALPATGDQLESLQVWLDHQVSIVRQGSVLIALAILWSDLFRVSAIVENELFPKLIHLELRHPLHEFHVPCLANDKREGLFSLINATYIVRLAIVLYLDVLVEVLL